MNHTKVPENRCISCGKLLDTLTCILHDSARLPSDDGACRPAEDDYILCFCGKLYQFNADLTIRPATRAAQRAIARARIREEN